MPLRQADDALHFLVDALESRPGSVQDQLRDAWFMHGAALLSEDLPEDNREDLQYFHDAMAGGVEALTDEEAAELGVRPRKFLDGRASRGFCD